MTRTLPKATNLKPNFGLTPRTPEPAVDLSEGVPYIQPPWEPVVQEYYIAENGWVAKRPATRAKSAVKPTVDRDDNKVMGKPGRKLVRYLRWPGGTIHETIRPASMRPVQIPSPDYYWRGSPEGEAEKARFQALSQDGQWTGR